jgi:hypothetical protein
MLLLCENLEPPMSQLGRVSRVSPVYMAVRNCTRDEGGPFDLDSIGCEGAAPAQCSS